MPVIEVIKLLIKLGPVAYQAYLTITKILDELDGTGYSATAAVAKSRVDEAMVAPRFERARRIKTISRELTGWKHETLNTRDTIEKSLRPTPDLPARPPSEGET